MILQINEENKVTLPSFIKYDSISRTIVIEPVMNEKTDQYKLSIVLKDEMGAQRRYILTVEVMSEEAYE